MADGGGEEKRRGGGWAARRRERLGAAAEAPGAAPEPGGGAEAGEGVGGLRGPSSGDGSSKCRLKRQLIGPLITDPVAVHMSGWGNVAEWYMGK